MWLSYTTFFFFLLDTRVYFVLSFRRPRRVAFILCVRVCVFSYYCVPNAQAKLRVQTKRNLPHDCSAIFLSSFYKISLYSYYHHKYTIYGYIYTPILYHAYLYSCAPSPVGFMHTFVRTNDVRTRSNIVLYCLYFVYI